MAARSVWYQTLMTLALLMVPIDSARGQVEEEWRLVPHGGYEASSEAVYLGLHVDRTATKRWLPDRLEHEVGFVASGVSRTALLYFENQWVVVRTGKDPFLLLGGGFGFSVRESIQIASLAGLSVKLEKAVGGNVRASFGARYIHASAGPEHIFPITIGISLPSP